jgi:hypothetical protein
MARRTFGPQTCAPHIETAPCWQAGRRFEGEFRPCSLGWCPARTCRGYDRELEVLDPVTANRFSRRRPKGRLLAVKRQLANELERRSPTHGRLCERMASVDRPSALDLAFLDLETVSLPAPGGAAELREVAGALLSGPLPPCAAGATCPPACGSSSRSACAVTTPWPWESHHVPPGRASGRRAGSAPRPGARAGGRLGGQGGRRRRRAGGAGPGGGRRAQARARRQRSANR